MSTIIALDLETTGLDPNRDQIIEIGAVRFKDGRIEDEWSTLVNPGRSIPKEISQLTNIRNSMVAGAPPIAGVIDELIAFIGDDTIIGHNVSFDLAFLRNQGAAENNLAADTYELASVLLPTSSRYNLGSLCRDHNIILKDAHRALDDARATGELYFALMAKAAQLPLNLLAMFVRLSEPFDWGAFWPFQQLLKEQRFQPIAGNLFDFQFGPLFETDNHYLLPPLEPKEDLIPLDTEEVASILQYGGPFSKFFPTYEYRPEQQHMLEAVTHALSYSQHLLVEAGTGTGKSLAYLIPSALFAIQNNTRVVISTNTINLQDQLIKKDIPDLRESLNIDLRAIVLKGRGNYLCPRRLEMMSKSRPPANTAELRVFAKIMVWLHEAGMGDRSEVNLNGPFEQAVWSRLNADFEGCNFDDCPRILNNSSCPYFQAHQAAQSAHILIVNHALLLADVATGNRVLPPYEYVIADEAHHIEDASTNSLSFKVSESDIRTSLRELGGKRGGILQRVLKTSVPLISPQQYGLMDQIVQRCTDLTFRLEHDFRNLFISMDEFLIDMRDGKPIGNYPQQVRIIPATRTQPSWTEVEIIWDQADETLQLLDNLLQQLHKEVGNIRQQFREELEEPATSLGFVMTSFAEVHKNLALILMDPDPGYIYWVATHPRNSNSISLNLAPLNVGPLMQEHIWHKKESVIMTSATLTTNGEFDYIRNRLYADDADDLLLGSPFDYENAAMLYIANDIAEPYQQQNYLKGVARAIVDTALSIGGNILVLFTSYAQLKRISKAITPVLSDNDVHVFTQGQGASPISLVESFKAAEHGVLLGTRSFWEGVDIPGEDLTCVMITKLPFDVPSDPIISARSETFESPFFEYSLPEAILKFRQGFGRLIRTQNDRGLVVILDRRVLTKSYGRSFIESLPPCQKKVAPLRDLPSTAAKWLNL